MPWAYHDRAAQIRAAVGRPALPVAFWPTENFKEEPPSANLHSRSDDRPTENLKEEGVAP